MGFPLPDELTGLTFDHLDIQSLLRCMQVSALTALFTYTAR